MGERKYRYPHFTNSKWKSSEPFREAHGRVGSSNWCLWALECCLGKTKLLHASRATGTGHRQTWFHNSATVLQGGRKLWATPPLILHKGMDICLTQRTLQMVFPQPWGYLSARPSFWIKLVSPLSSGLAGHDKIPNHCLTLLQFLAGTMDFPYRHQAQPVLVRWLWVWNSAICVFNSKSIFPPHCSSGLLGFHPTSWDRFKQKIWD